MNDILEGNAGIDNIHNAESFLKCYIEEFMGIPVCARINGKSNLGDWYYYGFDFPSMFLIEVNERIFHFNEEYIYKTKYGGLIDSLLKGDFKETSFLQIYLFSRCLDLDCFRYKSEKIYFLVNSLIYTECNHFMIFFDYSFKVNILEDLARSNDFREFRLRKMTIQYIVQQHALINDIEIIQSYPKEIGIYLLNMNSLEELMYIYGDRYTYEIKKISQYSNVRLFDVWRRYPEGSLDTFETNGI
jgi:hypothetical protein